MTIVLYGLMGLGIFVIFGALLAIIYQIYDLNKQHKKFIEDDPVTKWSKAYLENYMREKNACK